MSLSSTPLPRNSWRTSRNDAITPKMVLSTTATPATISVTWKAWSASGLVSASQTGPMPFSKVRQKMSPTGMISRNAR